MQPLFLSFEPDGHFGALPDTQEGFFPREQPIFLVLQLLPADLQHFTETLFELDDLWLEDGLADSTNCKTRKTIVKRKRWYALKFCFLLVITNSSQCISQSIPGSSFVVDHGPLWHLSLCCLISKKGRKKEKQSKENWPWWWWVWFQALMYYVYYTPIHPRWDQLVFTLSTLRVLFVFFFLTKWKFSDSWPIAKHIHDNVIHSKKNQNLLKNQTNLTRINHLTCSWRFSFYVKPRPKSSQTSGSQSFLHRKRQAKRD